MSEFCAACPLRGEVECEIVAKLVTQDVSGMITKNYGFPVGNLGVVADAEGNVSEVLNFSQTSDHFTTLASINERLDRCENPTERTGFFNKLLRRSAVCNALGDVAIDRSYPLDVSAADLLRPDFQRRGRRAAVAYRLAKRA